MSFVGQHIILDCVGRSPLLGAENRCRLLAECLVLAARRSDLRLNAFLFLPEGAEVIVSPMGARADLGRFARETMRLFSHRYLQRHHAAPEDNPLPLPTVAGGRFQFWHPVPRVRELHGLGQVLEAIKQLHGKPVVRGLADSPGAWRWSSYLQHLSPNAPLALEFPRVVSPVELQIA